MEQTSQQEEKHIVSLLREAQKKRGNNREELLSQAKKVLLSDMGIITRRELNGILGFLKSRATKKRYIDSLTQGMKKQKIRRVAYAFYEKPLYSFCKYEQKSKPAYYVFNAETKRAEVKNEPHLTISECVTASHTSTAKVKVISYDTIYVLA